MYKVISEGQVIAICDQPRYVKKKLTTGAWIQASEEEAEAIAVRGNLYGYKDHEVEDRPTAIVQEVDGSEYVFDNYVTHADYQATVANLEEALCDMDAANQKE